MKEHSLIRLLCVAPISICVSACAQGTFVNLNFESANLPILFPGQYGGQVPVTNALPGWQAFLGTDLQSTVWYNEATIGSAAVWVVGPNFEFWSPIEGNFTVLLTAGGGNSASISQTGFIPSATKSLQARIVTGPENFHFSLGGVMIPMSELSSNPDYTLYGGDVSAFANQIAELRITAPTTPSNPSYGFRLDSIVFSSQPIPEPSTLGLFAVGALLLGWRWHKARKS
jgi:hypothetical protein